VLPHTSLVAVQLSLQSQAGPGQGGSDEPDYDVELERDVGRHDISPRGADGRGYGTPGPD